MTALVGIDVGTSGVKAIALSPTGEILARAERDYPLSTPQPGWAEQDPDDWARAADAALADLGVEPASIGCSGQMHGLVVLDERGRGDPARRSSGTTSARRPSAPRSRSGSGSSA